MGERNHRGVANVVSLSDPRLLLMFSCSCDVGFDHCLLLIRFSFCVSSIEDRELDHPEGKALNY